MASSPVHKGPGATLRSLDLHSGHTFVGVGVAIQPGDGGRSPAILVSIVGSFAFALMVLSARSLRATPGSALVF